MHVIILMSVACRCPSICRLEGNRFPECSLFYGGPGPSNRHYGRSQQGETQFAKPIVFPQGVSFFPLNIPANRWQKVVADLPIPPETDNTRGVNVECSISLTLWSYCRFFSCLWRLHVGCNLLYCTCRAWQCTYYTYIRCIYIPLK